MNVKNENVRVLTKEEVIKLSNGVKRREFLDDYESWGVWLDIPELNVQVYKAELPMNRVIYVTRFKNYNTYGGEYASPVYRYGVGKVEYKLIYSNNNWFEVFRDKICGAYDGDSYVSDCCNIFDVLAETVETIWYDYRRDVDEKEE